MKPRYSGYKSIEFWDRVNELPITGPEGAVLYGEVYSLGCALQDLEGRVLRALHVAEGQAKHGS